MSTQRGRSATPYYIPSTSVQAQTPARPPSGGGTAATRQQPVQRSQARRWHQTLKGQFLLLASAGMLMAVVLALFTSLSFRRAADDLHTIAIDSIPSVNAAQKMAQYIDDIDAKAADYLATAGLNEQAPCTIIGSDRPATSLRVHDCDANTIDAEIILFNQELFNAAHNVTYPGERTAIERITAGFQEYVSDITLMRNEYALAQGKTDPNDPHLKNAYQAYQNAGKVLRQHINILPLFDSNNRPVFSEPNIPNCQIPGQKAYTPDEWALSGIETNIDCFNAINKEHLDQAYNDTASYLQSMALISGLLSLVFCALLLFLTVRMITLTHRFLNIGLAPALLVSVILSILVSSLFSGFVGDTQSSNAALHGAYQQLVRDDYESVYATAQLKRYGTNANADESRWLIALEFNDTASINLWATDWQNNVQKVTAAMQKARGNRTWREEDQPLANMQSSWNSYDSFDGQIRSMANNQADPNHLLNAERLSTSQSNQAFGAFTDAVDRLSQANQQHFDSTYQQTQSSLMVYILLCAILYPIIGLLAVWGVFLRLKDF